MIKTVKITNHLNESITLDLQNPEKSGFVIKSIDGLGPVNATINTTELSSDDGALYNSSRISSRNITMSLQFLENPTIESTRLLSYKYFPIKRNITIQIETDTRTCKISGRVESNEPDIFSNSEGCSISIICPEPYFSSLSYVKNTFYGIDPEFEFVYSNESTSEKLTEFGSINYRTEGTIYYSGDAENGVTITMHALGDVTDIVIYNLSTKETFAIDDDTLETISGSKITAGDDIIISTVKGSKGIKLVRDGVTTNILNAVKRPYQWFQLSKGDNKLLYTADGIEYLQFYTEHINLYEGV
jgi:hypothetical protein